MMEDLGFIEAAENIVEQILNLVEEKNEILIYYQGKQFHVYEDENEHVIHFLKLQDKPEVEHE